MCVLVETLSRANKKQKNKNNNINDNKQQQTTQQTTTTTTTNNNNNKQQTATTSNNKQQTKNNNKKHHQWLEDFKARTSVIFTRRRGSKRVNIFRELLHLQDRNLCLAAERPTCIIKLFGSHLMLYG